MIRKAFINSSQSLQRRTWHAMPNRAFPRTHRIYSDGRELHTLSSLPLHSFTTQNHGLVHPLRSDDDDDDMSSNNYNTLQHLISMSLRNSTSSTYLLNNMHKGHNSILLRHYHTTLPAERGAAIVLTLASVAATAKAGQYMVEGYKEWKEAGKAAAEEEEKRRSQLNSDTNADSQQQGEQQQQQRQQEDATAQAKGDSGASGSANAKGNAKKEQPRENFFAKFFNLSVGAKFYEGGFEEQMTRKEAALILGVRESSTPKRIKEAHRKLLILNHPDTGGSTYIAGKINEAKELLLQGKKM